jgi:hypothetical protein
MDIDLLEEYTILLLKAPTTERRTQKATLPQENQGNNQFMKTLLSQSNLRVTLIKSLKETKIDPESNRRIGVIEKVVNPFTLKSLMAIKPVQKSKLTLKHSRSILESRSQSEPEENIPVFPGCEKAVKRSIAKIKSLNVSRLDLENELLSKVAVPKPDPDQFFQYNPDSPWADLERSVFKDYYGSIFERKIPRGDVYRFEVKRPNDLLRVPQSLASKEYVNLVLKGKEKELLNFAADGSYASQSKVMEEPKVGLITLESQEVVKLKGLLKRFKRGLVKAKKQHEVFDHDEKEIKAGLAECLREAETYNKAREAKRKAEIDALVANQQPFYPGDHQKETKLLKVRQANQNFEVKSRLAIQRKAASFDAKVKHIDFVTKLRKPDSDIEQKNELKTIITDSEKSQKLLFLIKSIGFLRLVDSIRTASNLPSSDKYEKRSMKRQGGIRALILGKLLQYMKVQSSWIDGLANKNMIENLQRAIIKDRIMAQVRLRFIQVKLKVRMIQAFIRICLLKKKQILLQIQWKLDVYLVRVN